MARGEVFPAEWSTFTDADTGVEVKRLTRYKGHSNHLYFNNSGWHAGGKKLLFGSDRANTTSLYDIDLESGEITQLTDGDDDSIAVRPFQRASINPRREEAYFWQGRTLTAVSLETFESRPLYEAPDGFLANITSVTADGRYVCGGLYEALFRGAELVEIQKGQVSKSERMKIYWSAKPNSRVLRVDSATGEAVAAHEEPYWINHVNTSPALPAVLTFCHEGPGALIDHRIWGLDIETGERWKVRTGAKDGDRVTHEYWLSDGERIAYHGRGSSGEPLLGYVRYDDSERVDLPVDPGSTHTHSHDFSLIVGDGSRSDPRLLLWRFTDGVLEGPRVVATHNCSFQDDIVHTHPRFSPDGRHIVFTSDADRYGNVYLIDTPDFDTLPTLHGKG